MQEWQRTGYGAETTEDSVKWDELPITDELIEAIDDIEDYEIMKALETEGAETPDEEIKTVEGKVLKKGDRFYGIGVTPSNGDFKYVPFRCKFPQDYETVGDEENIFSTYEEAEKYCDKRNNLPEVEYTPE